MQVARADKTTDEEDEKNIRKRAPLVDVETFLKVLYQPLYYIEF